MMCHSRKKKIKQSAAGEVQQCLVQVQTQTYPLPHTHTQTQTHTSSGQSIVLPHDNRLPFVTAGWAEGSDQCKLLSPPAVVLCSQPAGIAEQDK